MAYKSEETHMLKALRMSRALKEKAGWSRQIGAGFIAEDMTELKLVGKDIHFTFGSSGIRNARYSRMNLASSYMDQDIFP